MVLFIKNLLGYVNESIRTFRQNPVNIHDPFTYICRIIWLVQMIRLDVQYIASYIFIACTRK